MEVGTAELEKVRSELREISGIAKQLGGINPEKKAKAWSTFKTNTRSCNKIRGCI